MALIACRNCQNQISDKADRCPHCEALVRVFYCRECRSELPDDATKCPNCGIVCGSSSRVLEWMESNRVARIVGGVVVFFGMTWFAAAISSWGKAGVLAQGTFLALTNIAIALAMIKKDERKNISNFSHWAVFGTALVVEYFLYGIRNFGQPFNAKDRLITIAAGTLLAFLLYRALPKVPERRFR